MSLQIIKSIFKDIYSETSRLVEKTETKYEELTDADVAVHTQILHGKFSKIENELLKYEKARNETRG